MASLGFGKRMDRISGLPNEIICHIVCFLSAKQAAFTSVLSKRFQNLFTIIPNLQFDDMVESQGSLTNFLDGVLALPASSRIRKFSLKCYMSVAPARYAHINHCLTDVLKRGVLDLELHIYAGKRYSLPFEVFTCNSVVELKLGTGFVIEVIPKTAFLPALETLILNSVRFEDLRGCAFQAFLSACHVLKELTIRGMKWERWKWSGNLSSPTLKRLTIARDDPYRSNSTRITLDTPSLAYLECCDLVADGYPIVNLDSLVEAKLDLRLTVDHNYEGFVYDGRNISSDPTNLIKGLRNVEIMNLLSPLTFQALSYFHEAIPVFENLYHLTITPFNVGVCWQFLPFLIKKSPNLETLVIKGPLHYNEQQPKSVCKCLSGYSFLLSCYVEVLEITEYNGTTGEVEQLKHFLEKLLFLKVVKLRSRVRGGGDDKKMIMLPRASSKCKIKVKFF